VVIVARSLVSPSCAENRARRIEGFTLIEVVVAVAVMTIILAPVMAATLALQDHSVDVGRSLAHRSSKDAQNGESGEVADSARPWSWSVAWVEDARWVDDALQVRVAALAGSALLEVGWWVDGWFEDSLEWRSTQEPTALLPVSQEDPATEIVVRVREEGGAWGVPWRMVCGATLMTPVGDENPGGVMDESGRSVTVVVPHAGGAGISDVSVSSSSPDSVAQTLQLPGAMALGSGWIQAVCGSREQSWWGGPGSIAHAFF
jgi:prepilin-type N-terminal cleavage/methylation domain-containing protein